MDNSQLKILIQATLAADAETKINGEIDKLKIKELIIPISVSTQEIKRILSELNVTINNSNKNQPKIKVFDTGDLDSQKIKYFEGVDDIENRVKAFYSTMGKAVDVTLFKNAQKDITGFTASVTDSSGILEKFKFKLSTLGNALGENPGFVYSGGGLVDKLIGKDYEAKMNKVLTMSNQIALAQTKAFNGSKSIKEAQHVSELNDRYEEITSTLYEVSNSNDALSKKQIRDLQLQINQVKALATTYQELEYAANKLAAKPIKYSVSEESSKLKNLEATYKNQGILTDKLKSKVEMLKKVLASVGDEAGLKKYQHYLELTEYSAKNLTGTMKKFNSELAQTTARNKLENYLKANPKALKANTQGFKELDESIKGINYSVANSDWNKKFTEVTGTVKVLGKTGDTILGNLTKNASKFFGWLLSSGAVMGAITTFKRMITTVIELDKALVNLQMATGGTHDETVKLLETYNKLGQRLGATTQEVADSANDWLRQGMSIADTNTMIENSLILSKVGMIGSAEATQFLTSATKGYNVSVGESVKILDMLTGVDLKAAVSAGGIAEAMSRTAASANIAGVEMSKLIGYLTTVGEVSQKDMSSIGESFNFGAAAA